MARGTTEGGERPTRAVVLAGLAVAAAIAAMIVVALVAFDNTRPELPRGLSVSEVTDDAARLAGRTLTVGGRVDVLTAEAMTLGEEDLIVVPADPRRQRFEGRVFTVGDLVYATGTLHILDAATLVRRVPGLSLLPSQFQGFDRQPVLIAEDVARVVQS
jgi:hypothetical protein